jgi:hypothetical protein
MLKKIILFAAFIFFVRGVYAYQNFNPGNAKIEKQTAEDIVIETAQDRLPEYETLTYAVKWLGIPVGRITASINGIKDINGSKAYELEVIVKTNAFCSAIYSIDDRFVSYMDTKLHHTLRHEVYRREGRYKKDAVTDFDYIHKKARFRNLLDNTEKTLDITEGIQDTLSACYYFRLLPAELNQKIEYSVYSNENIYQLFGIIESKDFVRLYGLGEKPALYIQPYARLQGEEVKKGRVSGYFSVDEKRIPLLAVVQAPMFTEITASLESIDYRQNSRH